MAFLTDVFESIRVINLQHRTDRKFEIESQLKRLDLDWSSSGVRIFRAIQPESAGDFPSIGARGCFLSHLQILREAVENFDESVLIIEDDLDFCKQILGKLDPTLRSLGKVDWSIFYGGYENSSFGNVRSIDAGLVFVESDVSIQTTHMVALRGRAIREAKEYLEAMLTRPPGSPEGGPMHVDGAYSWFRKDHPELKTVAAVPPLGFQRSSKSDIDTPKWYDRVPLVSILVAFARNAKNAFLR